MNPLKTLEDQISAMARSGIQSLPNITIAIVVLIATWLLAKSATKIARRLISHSRLRADLQQLLETLTRLSIWVFGVLLAATIAVPGLTPASLFAGLGVGALAIGFAFQDIFQNFLAGVLLMLRDKMQIGDNVSCEGIDGKVERITLRETHVRQYSGELTIVPNSTLFKNPVEILTDQHFRRDQITVGVAYDTDLDDARGVIHAAIAEVDAVATGRSIDVFVREFNASSIDFLVRWWTDTTKHDIFTSRSDVMRAIKRALDDAEIEIPFPVVTNTFVQSIPTEPPAGGNSGTGKASQREATPEVVRRT